jgi:hypothetical protein
MNEGSLYGLQEKGSYMSFQKMMLEVQYFQKYLAPPLTGVCHY